MAAELDRLWADALSAFYAATDKKLDDGSWPLLATVQDLQAELSKRLANFAAFREKRHVIFDGLSKALKPVELLGNIAAGGIANAFPPGGVAISAVIYMITAAGNVSAAYDSICDLLEELGQFTTRLTVHLRQEISSELRGIVLQILCSLIRLCGYSARLIKHGRVGEYFKKVYLGKDAQVSAEMETLRRLTETEARMVGALTFSTVTRTSKQVDNTVVVLADVKAGMSEANAGINDIRDQVSSLVVKMNEMKTEDRNDSERKQLEKIRLALSPSVTPEEIYRAISGKRVPGTGDWIHDERLFKQWLDLEKPILWISGGPGAGKSYLSSNIIQLLTQLHPQRVQASSRISIAYYFCKDYNPELRSFNKALRTLAYQICQNDPVFAKYVAGVCSFPEDIRTTESLWQKLFVEFFGSDDSQSTVYILIDGIDEAFEQERTSFLELLKTLQNSASVGGQMRVQILMVGRPELNYDIEQVLEENLPNISVSAQKNSGDILNYVTTKVSKERNLRRISKELHDEIIMELTKGADGMFLWVDLMLKEVASKHKEIQMRQALHEAPKGLFDTIEHTLERIHQEISKEDAEDLTTLLSWVTCAKRPLRLGELDGIMKLTSPSGEGVVYLEGELRKRYASFFNVTRQDGRTTEDLQMERVIIVPEEEEKDITTGEAAVKVVNNDTGVFDDFGEDMDIDSDPNTTEVTLTHASFGDFFRKHQSTERSGSDFSTWSLQIVKQLLRMICEKEVMDKWSNSSLSGYACAYWQDHLRDVDIESVKAEDRTEICKRLFSVFCDDKILTVWSLTATGMQFFRDSWIFTDKNSIAVRQWLALTPSQATEEEREWSTSLCSNAGAEVIEKAMAALARSWLQEAIGFPQACFMALKAYQDKMEAHKTNGPLPKATDYAASDLAHNSAETILEVARHWKFEEDCNWSGRVGKVLREAGHYDVAKLYIQKAIDTAGPGDHPWRPWTGMGLLYAEQQKYQEAITATRKALELAKADPGITEAEKTSIHNYWTTEMLNWHSQIDDVEPALALCQEILRLYPEEYSVATRYIQIFAEQKRYNEGMDVLRKASEENLEAVGHSRLTQWCIMTMWLLRGINFYESITAICRGVGNMDFAKQTYLTALKSVKKTDTDTLFVMQADYGTLLLRELRKPRQAARLFEKILDEAKASKKDTGSFYARVVVCDQLCEIYLNRARASGKDSVEAARCIEKLSLIWPQQDQISFLANTNPNDATQDLFQGNIFYTTRNSTLSLASLYRVFNLPEKATRLLRLHIKLGLDLLTDNDPTNDWQGYAKLADAMSRAGDHPFALAAYAMYAPKYVGEPVSDDNAKYGCDGCGRLSANGGELMYACKYCIDKAFDEPCYQLLKADKLPIHVCGYDHEFLYIPVVEPWEKGMVPVEGTMVPEKDFLAQVRKKWDL